MDALAIEAYGDAYADVYDDWYPAGADDQAAATLIASLAQGRPVLELGVGTGRIATAVASHGLDVWGLDASAAMIACLRTKPGGASIRTVLGDMADFELPNDAPEFGVVVAAFNTLMCLPDRDQQLACLRRAADATASGGCVLIETFIPPPPPPERRTLEVTAVELDRVLLKVSEWLPAAGAVGGHHIELSERGVKLRPWRLQLITPSQLDELAARASLRLTARYGGWAKEPFHVAGRNQVSVYTSVR